MNYCTICGIALRDGMTCKECQSRINGFVSLLSPVEHEDGNEYPRSLERFYLDDDTGPEQPYLGDELR